MSKAIKFRTKDNEPVYPCPYFPVGFVYLSATNINPSTYFGGTWEQIKDKFLLTSGNTYTAGTTGGSASHNHTLSSKGYAELSLHGSGEIKYHELNTSTGVTPWNANFKVNGNSGTSFSESSQWGASLAGKTESSNTLPPYYVVYAWRRTA